jgi:integrase
MSRVFKCEFGFRRIRSLKISKIVVKNMAYQNLGHRGRLIVIPVVENAFANLFQKYKSDRSIQVALAATDPAVLLRLEPDYGTELQRHVYNMPYLLSADGMPWTEANSFFLNLVEGEHARNRPTDAVRRKASHLMDYKLYCELHDIDWLNFSGRRRIHRPTYRYFRYLVDSENVSAGTLNQKTATIFQFYNYISLNWHEIDLTRVDTYKDIEIQLSTVSGAHSVVKARKRSQTVQRAPEPVVSIGYVREHGEELRPLTNEELREFLAIIRRESWTQSERLIIKTALTTGARKQTILTLRHSHLKKMIDSGVQKNGFYKLHVGPNSGVDTKFNKKQVLYFPARLVEQLSVFVESEFYKARRNRFLLSRGVDLSNSSRGQYDAYIFLSEQGQCFYMAKNDPLYAYIKSPPTGQMTDYIKRKLVKDSSTNFPKDFTFHWLRATFGYLVYQWLMPLVTSGKLKAGEEMEIIQRRMHHKNRETTENYLKLYRGIDERLFSQEIFESEIFDWDSQPLEGGVEG